MTTSKKLSSDEKVFGTEAPLTAKVKAWLELQKDIHFYKASDRYNKGVSDMILCVGGIFVAIELKAEGNEMSPHQRLFIKQIRDTGGVSGEARTLGAVKTLISIARDKAKKLG